MNRRVLFLSALVFLLLIFTGSPSAAEDITIWNSPKTLVDVEEVLDIGRGPTASAVRIRAPGAGTYSIQVPLFLASNLVVSSVELCYDLTNAASYIDALRLVEIQQPGSGVLRLNDNADLKSVTPVCYRTAVATIPPSYSPAGSVYLELTFVFANSSDLIHIGAIAIHMESAP